jgi:TNF receptor-associated factor 4
MEEEEIIIDEEFKIINIGSELVIEEFQEISEDMICIICQNIVRTPVLCQECNGLFCYQCINKWNSSYPTCPACRKKFKEKNLPKNFLNIINKIKLLCQFSYKGCDKILKYESFFQHIDVCEFALCKCVSKECSFRDIRKNIREHIKLCIYVIEKCKYCQFKAMRLYIGQHLVSCKYFPLYCQICKLTVIRKNFPSHNDSKCLEKLNKTYSIYNGSNCF